MLATWSRCFVVLGLTVTVSGCIVGVSGVKGAVVTQRIERHGRHESVSGLARFIPKSDFIVLLHDTSGSVPGVPETARVGRQWSSGRPMIRVIGLNHQTAPIDVRERIAVGD